MTTEEVAEFLRVHAFTIYRLIKQQRIPAFKIGSDWRFNRTSIEQWISEREAGFASEQALEPAGPVEGSSVRLNGARRRSRRPGRGAAAVPPR